MMKKLYTFLVLVLFLPLSTMAQMHYPIRTNTIVTPPVPFSLDGFVSQPGKLMLNVLVDDVTLSQYPVKLQLHIEGNGIRISSNPNIPQQPIYLDGGVTTQLTGSDLEFYFNPENLLFQGYSLNEYRRNGRLPEGVYRIRFEVLDFYRDFKVSSAIPAVAMMSLTNGPVLTFPANRSEIDVDANPVLRFSWMAVFTAIPDALIEYRFKLWQIRPDNRDPFEITKVTTPVYEVDLSETALLYDGSLPPLEKGARYVWQVTALDLSGNVLFKKDGNSDIATFRYGYECAAPSAVISKVSHNSVSVSWNSNSSIREYIVSYRKENDSEWQEVTTSNVGLTIDNLEHSVQYELYVRASCGDASSNNERLLRFKTDRFVDYSCGAGAPRISFENQDPLPALHRFDEFKAADFYIEVTEVSGSQGVFSGRGLASIPFLEFLKFEVSFNDITINTDRQMIDGHVVFLHEEETGKIPGRNMGVGGSQGAEGSQELSFEEALNEIADQKVTIDEEVADVSVSNGNVTVVTESGQTQSYLVGENQTLAIVTPESIVVVDQASGQVFQAPNTPPGSSSNVRTPSQSGIHGCLVTFRPSATQRLGFDAVGNGVVKPNSYFLRDRNGDAVPWKSLEAGNTDYVAMLTNGDCQADSLRFIRESGLLSPTTPGRNNSLELLLTGGFQGQEERLTVARATTNHINDSTSEEILTEAGVLGLVSYQRITRDVFLIPVNGASFPTASTQLSDIEKRLNEIYGSAVINWNVHFDEPIEVGRINEAEFKVEGTAMLSKYTSDMNRVIRTYKRNRPADDNSLYLFFVELSDLGTSRKGFMPLAGNFGFIFNFSASDFDLLAHELAHGAFNLRHTFSDKAQHYFPVQQTANLMDYAGGTDLWKYQWDLIHNPESILFAWAQDEEEGAMIDIAHREWVKAPQSSGLYLAPSLFPIWLDGVTEIAVLKDAEIGVDLRYVPSEAIYGFRTSESTFYAEVTTELFAGFKEEGGNTSISFMGTGKETQAETEKSSYSLLLWDIDKDEFISRQINNNKWFPEPSSWGSYSAAGTLVSGIDEFTFMSCGHLLRDYAESPIMDSRILRTAIYKDPCLLEHPFVPMGEGLGYETEFMKGLNTMVGAGLAAAFFPAAVEIVLVPILEQSLPAIVNEGGSFFTGYLTRKKAIDVAVGVTLDVTLQSFILHVFEDVHLSEVPGRIDYYQTTISGTEALIDNQFLETFITPLYGAFFDNGRIKEDVQFDRVYSDYLQGAATALLIRIATERAPGAGKALRNNLIKLKGIAKKSLPDFKIKLSSKGISDADIDEIVRYLDELEGDVVKGAGKNEAADIVADLASDTKALSYSTGGGNYKINPQKIRQAAVNWNVTKKTRFDIADSYYNKSGYINYDNHLRGIDFDKEVKSISVEKGEYLYQYCKIDAKGNLQIGDYFYTTKDININNLGFDAEGRVMIRVKLQEKSDFLQSTAADIEDWMPGSTKVFQGGEIQLFNSNTKLTDVTILK